MCTLLPVALMLVCGVSCPPDKDYVYSAASGLDAGIRVWKPPDKDYVYSTASGLDAGMRGELSSR